VILVRFIQLYRRYRAVNRAVKLAIRLHHAVVPGSRSACTLADCAGTGLAEAQEMGWRALPGILSRISACGTRHRRPKCADNDGIFAGVDDWKCDGILPKERSSVTGRQFCDGCDWDTRASWL
jgi:hypothetical protein